MKTMKKKKNGKGKWRSTLKAYEIEVDKTH